MIKVDENTCIGCGACVAIDGEHFDFNEAGLSVATAQDVTDSVKEAADACPVGAITYTEGETAITEATAEDVTEGEDTVATPTTEDIVEGANTDPTMAEVIEKESKIDA